MKNNKHNSNSMNNSKKVTYTPNQDIIKAIDAIDPTVGGSVSYIFQTLRTRYNAEFPEGQDYVHESKLVSAIGVQALVTIGTTGKRLRRNSTELARLLYDTMLDMGAKGFVVN